MHTRRLGLSVALATALLVCVLPAAAMAKPSRPVAFVKGGELRVATSTGERVRKLTSTQGKVRSPSWFPDGKRLAYVRDGYADGHSDIWDRALKVVDVKTGRSETLKLKMPKVRCTDECGTSYLDWRTLEITSIAVSPDGKRLLAVSKGVDAYGIKEGFRVLVFTLSTGTGKQIKYYSEYDCDTANAGWKSNSTVWIGRYFGDAGKFTTVKATGGASKSVKLSSAASLAWSPDGKRIAWCQDKGDYGAKANAVRVSTSSGGSGRTIARGTKVGEVWWTPPSWSADAKYVYAVTDRGLHRVKANGKGSKRIATAVTEVTVWKPKRK